MVVLALVTMVALVLIKEENIGVIGVVLIGLHVVFRGMEDLDLVMDDQESPYGALLSDDADPSGNYTIM
ncbi:hypothetical protein PS1_018395 [Malus domestica]